MDAFLWREPRRTTRGRVNNGASLLHVQLPTHRRRLPLSYAKIESTAGNGKERRREESGGEVEANTARIGLAATLLITFYYNVLVGVIFMVFAMLNDFFMCPAIFSPSPPFSFPPPSLRLLSMLIALGSLFA